VNQQINTTIKNIEIRISELEEKVEEPNEELNYLHDVLNPYIGVPIEELANISTFDYFLCAYLTFQNNKLTITELREKTKHLVPLIEKMRHTEEHAEFLDTLITELQFFGAEKLREAYVKKEGASFSLFKKPSKEEVVIEKMKSYISGLFRESKKDAMEDLDIILYLAENSEEGFVAGIASIFNINSLRAAIINYQSTMKQFGITSPTKKVKKINEKYVNQMIYNKPLMGEILKYYSDSARKDQQTRKQMNRQISSYKKLKEWMSSLEKIGEITQLPEELKKLPNDSIKHAILFAVYCHNIRGYKSLASEYQNLLQNSDLVYQNILRENGINPTLVNLQAVKKNSLEDVEWMIKTLKQFEIISPNVIGAIIQSANLQAFTLLYVSTTNGMINQTILSNNPDIFIPSSINHANFFQNLHYFTSKEVSPLTFGQNSEALLQPTETFKRNIDILEQYGLLKSMRGDNYQFLSHENLETEIDRIIELGFETELTKDISLLNREKDRWKRVQLLKAMNMPVTTKEELMGILDTPTFMFPDSQIDNYLYNAVPISISEKLSAVPEKEEVVEPEFLSSYTASPRTYKIGNCILSKNRVLRNYSRLNGIEMDENERLFVSVVSGSVLTDTEYQSIRKEITPPEKK